MIGNTETVTMRNPWLILLVCIAVPETTADEPSPTAALSVQSDTKWNGRRVEDDAALLHVMVPASPKPDLIPMSVTLGNRGQATFHGGASGYLLDCKLTLMSADGIKVPYTNQGKNLFSDNSHGGQHVTVQYAPGTYHHWQYNLSKAFGPLGPGSYRLDLEAKLWFGDRTDHKSLKVVVLKAKQLDFEIR